MCLLNARKPREMMLTAYDFVDTSVLPGTGRKDWPARSNTITKQRKRQKERNKNNRGGTAIRIIDPFCEKQNPTRARGMVLNNTTISEEELVRKHATYLVREAGVVFQHVHQA